MQHLRIDAKIEALLDKSDPALQDFRQFKDEFGRNDDIIISIHSDNIFTETFLKQLTTLHTQLETEVPYAHSVSSLYNARNIYGADDELIVEDLLDILPEDKKGYAKLKEKVVNHRYYQDLFISRDQQATNIYLTPDIYFAFQDPETNKQHKQLVGDLELHTMIVTINKITAQYPELRANMHISGMGVVNDEMSVYISRDILLFVSISLLVIMVILYSIYRRILTVLLPLVVIIMALVSTMGLMGATVKDVHIPTVILPSFILAVGVGDAIHFLTIFFRGLKQGKNKHQATVYAMRHTGLPMFFTSITTAASLCSFAQSDLVPIANLGIFAAAGIIFAFLYTILLLPALLAISPVRLTSSTINDNKTNNKNGYGLAIHTFIDFSSRLAVQHSLKVSCAGIVLMIVAFIIALQLPFSHDPVKWLPESSSTRVAIKDIEDRFGGAIPIDIIIDSGEYDGVKSPVFMKQRESFVIALPEVKTPELSAGRVVSLTDLLKETNQALFANQIDEYRIPDNRPLIAQEFLMLEASGAKDLFKLVDKNYQKVHVTIMTPWVDSLLFVPYINALQKRADQHFSGQYSAKVTGIVPLLSRILKQIIYSTAFSYLLAFVVISIMMILLLGSVKYGLISMIPNLLPITVALAIMQITGSPLDMFSMLIGSIAIGLAVDDTVHFMHGFRRNFSINNDVYQAVSETLHSTGRAMLTTTLVLSLGFLTYLSSSMNNLQDFGFYTALCIVLALLADFWLAPALMVLLHEKPKNSRH